jgi:hypothetical protein
VERETNYRRPKNPPHGAVPSPLSVVPQPAKLPQRYLKYLDTPPTKPPDCTVAVLLRRSLQATYGLGCLGSAPTPRLEGLQLQGLPETTSEQSLLLPYVHARTFRATHARRGSGVSCLGGVRGHSELSARLIRRRNEALVRS